MTGRVKEKDMYKLEGGITYNLHDFTSHDTNM